jgi:hypothetical protein
MIPVEPPFPYCRVAPCSTTTAGWSGSEMIGYGQFPPLVVTLWCWSAPGSVKSLFFVRTKVPDPAIVSVP